MMPENAKLIWKSIQEAGDYLKDKLPNHAHHPKGRNSYAHVSLEIKNHFGKSYKDISDDKIEDILSFIEYLRSNPN